MFTAELVESDSVVLALSPPVEYISEGESDSAILAEFVEQRLSKFLLSWWESRLNQLVLSFVSQIQHSFICRVN